MMSERRSQKLDINWESICTVIPRPEYSSRLRPVPAPFCKQSEELDGFGVPLAEWSMWGRADSLSTFDHIINLLFSPPHVDTLDERVQLGFSINAIINFFLRSFLLRSMSIVSVRLLRLSALCASSRTSTLASTRSPALSSLRASAATKPAPVSRLSNLTRQFSSSTSKMAPITKQYDYIVIGGGSGGSGAARRASGWYGAKTCIIDEGVPGGCCVNVG